MRSKEESDEGAQVSDLRPPVSDLERQEAEGREVTGGRGPVVDEPRPAAWRRAPVGLMTALLTVAAAAGVAADRLSPASPRGLPAVGDVTPGGVWACPIVSLGKRGGYLSLANGSVNASSVRVRFFRPPLAPVELGLALAPGHAATLRAPAGDAPVSAIVHWAGGDVVASRSASVVTPQGRVAATGATCSRTGETTLAIPGLQTLGADSRLVLVNPSSADAVVDVSFLVGGDERSPESLSRRVVPPRGRLEVRAGDFIFDKTGFAALVRVSTGSIVADGLVIFRQGARVTPAVAPRREGVAAGESVFGAFVNVVAVGDEPSTVVATTILPGGQQTTADFPAALDPFGPAAVAFPERGPLSVVLSERQGSPFVASLGWSLKPRGAGDVTALPFTDVSRRWLAVTQSAIGTPGARIVLSNPGEEPARLRARLLTPDGQAAFGEIADITLLPGRVRAFPIGSVGSALGVEVVSLDGPVGFALVVTAGIGDEAFLYAMNGVSSRSPRRVPVVVDPPAGVPARL